MTTEPDNSHIEILKELYEMDPGLKQHEAVLSQLIRDLGQKQPTIGINPAFVASLRTKLLEYKPALQSNHTPNLSPLLWWITRLAPAGVAFVLFIALLPHTTTAPIEPVHEEAAGDTVNESSQFDPSRFSTESAMGGASLKATAPALMVEPPEIGSTITITSLTLSEPGWIVVYEDAGGSFGATLHHSYMAAGTYTDLSLPLQRLLTYPELVSVAVYTGNEPAAFTISKETIQIDPDTDDPLTVTIPVVSDVELEGSN